MNKIKLTKEESSIEKNAHKYVPATAERKRQIEKIINESKKSRAISLRINENDLESLKLKAERNGLPYQTMINVIIHKYVTDSYIDKYEIDKYLKLKKTG